MPNKAATSTFADLHSTETFRRMRDKVKTSEQKVADLETELSSLRSPGKHLPVLDSTMSNSRLSARRLQTTCRVNRL